MTTSGEQLQAIQSADALIAGLTASTKKYHEAARKALDGFGTSWQGFSDTVRHTGPKTAQRYLTQVTNLVKEAKRGPPLRAYHPYYQEPPLNKAAKILVQGRGPAKGLALALAESPVLLQALQADVLPALRNVQSVCSDWHQLAQDHGDKIRDLMGKAYAHAEPFQHGFASDPGREKWAAAQRPFAKETNRLRDIVIHKATGLAGGSGSFADCADVDECLKALTHTNNDLLKLHKDFNKRWADYQAAHEGKYKDQRSLF